jgi:hypothetical protein
MAVSSKTIKIFTLILALCGGTFGALVFFAYRNHFGFGTLGQVAFVSLGAILGFGGVWLCFWIGQNLFVESPQNESDAA